MRWIYSFFVLIVLAACGAADRTPVPLEYSRAADTVVLELTSGGGMMPFGYIKVNATPLFRLYGDGRAIYRHYNGARTMRWETVSFAPIEVAALLRDVLGPNQELCLPIAVPPSQQTDSNFTRITVNLASQTCAAVAENIGSEQRPELSGAEADLFGQIEHASTAINTIIGQTAQPYQPASVTIHVDPIIASNQAEPWPFAAELLKDQLVVSGSQAVALLERASLPRDFSSNGQFFQVVVVPVLP